MKIQAFFWDYDNTILTTAEAHWKKHKTVLGNNGIQLNEKFCQRIYENNGNQNWEWIKEELGLQLPEKEYLKQIDAEFQRYLNELEVRPGIKELFELIAEKEIPQAIITNARKDSAKPILEKKKIVSWMKFILYKEDYCRRKPDPEPYLEGFKKMGELLGKHINPKLCIAVEDDPKGVESAHRAGAIVIHRKLHASQPSSAYANYSCYDEHEFIEIVTHLLNNH